MQGNSPRIYLTGERKKMPRGFRLSQHLLFQSKTAFEPYLGEKALLRGIAERKVFSGELLVSHHNNSKSKVVTQNNERFGCAGFVHRNRALSGDEVYAMQTEHADDSATPAESENDETVSTLQDVLNSVESMGDNQRSCKVVAIKKRSGQRYVARTRPNDAVVQPRDPRFPAMRLSGPPLKPSDKVNLFLVGLKEWEETEQYPTCDLLRVLGQEGNFDAEDDASLEMNGLRSEVFSEEIDAELRKSFPSAEKVVARALANGRRDCRYENVFSIDPLSAKDLDDAISVKKLKTGNFQIGVHVADVSHFVRIGTRVDAEARLRSTSVYLPRKVYPMLPPYLSENLCSLVPNEDRLALSVYFTLTKQGEVVESRSGGPEIVRTVIRSRAKLSYEEVDAGKKLPKDLRRDISVLLDLTAKLRNRRIANGSISIDDRNSKEILKFEFASLPDGETFPVQLRVTDDSSPLSEKKLAHDSHMLIEELMVLTNKIIAEKLCSNSSVTLPVVRRHVESEDAVRKAAVSFLAQAGVKSSEKSSLTDILSAAKKGLQSDLFSAFTHSILGEFHRAEYNLLAVSTSPQSHWGVGAERYMHFTSPIRRYADLIVHRKLAAIANLTGPDEIWESDETVAQQIKQCNVKSRAAQEAEKDNKLFYFSTFVKSFGNYGFPVSAIVKQLIAPNDEKNIKGSVCLFLPILGDERSQSLESLGLQVVSAKLGKDEQVESFNVLEKKSGKNFELKLLSNIVVRAFVKSTGSPVSKFHLRLDTPPPPPSST